VTGAVGPGVIKEVASMVDLIVSQVLDGGHAIDDMWGNTVVGIGISQKFGALKALLSDVS
jgi:hypothetical protein